VPVSTGFPSTLTPNAAVARCGSLPPSPRALPIGMYYTYPQCAHHPWAS
jgi:hypothetical protein